MIGYCTRFCSAWPKVLGKRFRLDSSGALMKETSGNLSRGSYRVESFDSPEALVKLLTSFAPNEALSASVPNDGSQSGAIVTESALASHPDAKARTRKHFNLADGPGLGIVDVDEARLTLDQLRDEVLAAVPALAGATLIGWYSGSSLIFDGETCVSPAKGLRLYLPIASAADWPRALHALNARLASRGHFRCIVSSAGAILDRPLLDAAMGDAGARLDFAPTGAICEPPLQQRRPSPQVLHAGAAFFIDTHEAIPDITPEEDARYRAAIHQARDAVQAEAEAKRAAWRAEHERTAIASALAKGEAVDSDQARIEARRTLDAALHGQLMPSFELIRVDPEGKEHATTVAELLKDPGRHHLEKFLCPLNHEHRNRTPDAIFYGDQPVPVLFDLDTRIAYRLVRQQLALQVVQGERARLATQIAQHLKGEPDIFLLNGQLVMLRPCEATA